MVTKKILIVDDEDKIRRILRQVMEKEGYQVMEAINGFEALNISRKNSPDLIILDIMMPELDGLEFLKRIRPDSEIPVIILSAKDAILDKALAYNLDVDDYVAKPFSPLEMAMRVKAVLKRSTKTEHSQSIIRVGEFEINLTSHQFFARGREIELTPREFKLLGIFMRHAGIVLSREQLLEQLDDGMYFGDINVINVFVRRLRQKIEDDPANPLYLQTVWGIGYKLSNNN